MNTYRISSELSIPAEAPANRADLTFTEITRGYRVIGGDRGDLQFDGYTVGFGRTVLYKPVLVTTLDLSDEEAAEIAKEILMFSYESIGVESVTHS